MRIKRRKEQTKDYTSTYEKWGYYQIYDVFDTSSDSDHSDFVANGLIRLWRLRF